MPRIVTAASLFDGHDAAINLFRSLLQRAGFEVIHLGHNRSVEEIVQCAVQEDADAICISSYQGGHMEFFRYMLHKLKEAGAEDIALFGGGGGTMLHHEIDELVGEGVTALYHADDGQRLGLFGIIEDIKSKIGKRKKVPLDLSDIGLAKWITAIENKEETPPLPGSAPACVLGVTGTGGSGKSSLIDELICRYLASVKEGRVAVIAFDPTKKKTGGALLGDRIRMNSIYGGRVFLRSLATRGSTFEMAECAKAVGELLKRAGFSLVILETSGIGQGNAAVAPLSDASLYVMTAEYGASSQLEKIDMIDFADLIAINKFEKMGAEDALDDVMHAYARSHDEIVTKENRSTFPVFGTIASSFNNEGVNQLFACIIEVLRKKGFPFKNVDLEELQNLRHARDFVIIPLKRSHYLSEIAGAVRTYKLETKKEAEKAARYFYISQAQKIAPHDHLLKVLEREKLNDEIVACINAYHDLQKRYLQERLSYTVRGKSVTQPLYYHTLSNTKMPRVTIPHLADYGAIVTYMRQENVPGAFPYTAGVFPLKHPFEMPKRQFAGEGSPKSTNLRFHYLSHGDKAKRLSTAFDSVTLYGEDPGERLDIFGKVGNSGVSIATLDHMKQLFAGFDLTDPHTSVSLTINGPAPIILAMFFNTAIDFEMEKEGGDYETIKSEVLKKVRGTVQADILKEEQAQNTCIFSSQFALKMMGDMQQYFIAQQIHNFYSISISGYHIAEAGANPITQLAFTLANGFTYIEYYLARGMLIDEIASNLSFFFSAGLDPEYSVIGRVARRIWAIALKERYGANERSCKLKYHIQTSGRSLHAREIAFNDIRTTLQALTSIYDNCNSLHTNAYDEAITTPTEESVRRAMAIQLIISEEFGMAKCENVMQGSYILERLTDLVEEAVLTEFESISRRGGVLGAMEKQYQRHRIQTESLKYEKLKNSCELPVIGVNTFVGKESGIDESKIHVIRASNEEKQEQIASTRAFIERAGNKNKEALDKLRTVALEGNNIFAELMETVKHASLGQITHLLYECGGKYRRSM